MKDIETRNIHDTPSWSSCEPMPFCVNDFAVQKYSAIAWQVRIHGLRPMEIGNWSH